MYPPIRGPAMGPNMAPTPKIAIAIPCSLGGNVSRRIACDIGCSAPPPIPCRTRKKTSIPRPRGGAPPGGKPPRELPLRHRLRPPPADPLQDAEEDEHPQARGGAAQQGGEGEQEDGEGEGPLPPEGGGEAPRHRGGCGV